MKWLPAAKQVELLAILLPLLFVWFYTPSSAELFHRCRKSNVGSSSSSVGVGGMAMMGRSSRSTSSSISTGGSSSTTTSGVDGVSGSGSSGNSGAKNSNKQQQQHQQGMMRTESNNKESSSDSSDSSNSRSGEGRSKRSSASSPSGFSSLLDDLQNTECKPCYLDPAAQTGSSSSLLTLTATGASGETISSAFFHGPTNIFNAHAHAAQQAHLAELNGIYNQHHQQPFQPTVLPMHVIVLLTTQQTFERCMVTTAGLLTRGARVTVVSAPNMPPEDLIRPALSQHIPCEQQAFAHANLLNFRTFHVDPTKLPCPRAYLPDPTRSPGDIIWCSVLNAAPMFHSMSDTIRSVLAEVALLSTAATASSFSTKSSSSTAASAVAAAAAAMGNPPAVATKTTTTTSTLATTSSSPPNPQGSGSCDNDYDEEDGDEDDDDYDDMDDDDDSFILRHHREQSASSANHPFHHYHNGHGQVIPTVLLLDATSVAGQLLAEKFLIPSIMLVENTDVLQQVLGSPPPAKKKASSLPNAWIEADAGAPFATRQIYGQAFTGPNGAIPTAHDDWEARTYYPPQNQQTFQQQPYVINSGVASSSASRASFWSRWWNRFTDAAQDRLNSLDLTSAFVALNRVRRSVGLPRIRRVSDLWRSPGNLLWIASREADGWKEVLPNLLTYSGPFLPPCLACEGTTSTNNNHNNQDDERNRQSKDKKKSNYDSKRNDDSKNSTDSSSSGGSSHSSSSQKKKKPNDYDNSAVKENIPSIVVSAASRNDEAGRGTLRRVVRGFVLARESMRQFQNCGGGGNAEGGHGDGNQTSSSSAKLNQTIYGSAIGASNYFQVIDNTWCWDDARDFEVIMLGPEHDVVLPDFIRHGRSNFMETLALSRPTLAIVSLCDTTNAWTHHLGPPVLCLNVKWTAHEVAYHLLRTLRRHRQHRMAILNRTLNGEEDELQDDEDSDSCDVLETIIDILYKAAMLKAREGKTWKSGWDMGRAVMREINLFGKHKSNADGDDDDDDDNDEDGVGVDYDHDFFSPFDDKSTDSSFFRTMLIGAWLNLISVLVYVVFRKNMPSQWEKHNFTSSRMMAGTGGSTSSRMKQRNSHLHQNPVHSFRQSQAARMEVLLEEIMLRLPELDRLWTLWKDWVDEILAQMAEINGPVPAPPIPPNGNINGGGVSANLSTTKMAAFQQQQQGSATMIMHASGDNGIIYGATMNGHVGSATNGRIYQDSGSVDGSAARRRKNTKKRH